MTHKQRFRTVLEGGLADRIPMVSRLDIWHSAVKGTDALPPECRGKSLHEIEAMLGMGRSARFMGFRREAFPGVETAERREGGLVHTEWRLGGRALRMSVAWSQNQVQQGMLSHTIERPLKSAEDYETLAAMWENMEWRFDTEGFEKFSEEVGEEGMPMIVDGPIPVHRIMIDLAGYEDFYLHLADFPAQVERLAGILGERYRELWAAVGRTSAEIVLHGAHWSSDMTPPPVFRRFFLPYCQSFAAALHAAGKRFVFHADAELKGMEPLVLESGADVADCFACAPLVRLTLREARAAWGARVVVWGGVPSIVLEPSFPRAEFAAWLDDFCEEIADGRAVIVAVSDNVMPTSDFGRLREVAERVAAIKVG